MTRFSNIFFMIALGIALVAVGPATLVVAAPATAAKTIVLFNDTVVEIENTLADPNDLWVSPEDLTRVTGLVLKPEGACLADICIPVKQDADTDLFVSREGKNWLNATGLAKKLRQGVVVDRAKRVWSFGQVPATRTAFHEKAMAPDFALKDRQGNTIRLSDYRGKKVIIMTWASW